MAKYNPTTKNNDCIFCKIASKEFDTPGLFWEDEHFMAFLSIDPNTEGFSVVIPKNHYGSDVLKMPNDMLTEFVLAAKTVAEILEDSFPDVGRVGLIMEGTGIDHAHIKLVPMHGTEWMKRGEWKQIPSHREDWFDTYPGWLSSAGGPMANPERLHELAGKLKKLSILHNFPIRLPR